MAEAATKAETIEKAAGAIAKSAKEAAVTKQAENTMAEAATEAKAKSEILFKAL